MVPPGKKKKEKTGPTGEREKEKKERKERKGREKRFDFGVSSGFSAFEFIRSFA
jgi:hypothetical protein